VNCQLYERRELKHSSVLSSESAEELKNIKKHAASSNGAVHDTNNRKTFTRQLPVLCDNCVLTPTVTTDVDQQHTATCPLLPAAAIRRVLRANSFTYFLYISPVFPQHFLARPFMHRRNLRRL